MPLSHCLLLLVLVNGPLVIRGSSSLLKQKDNMVLTDSSSWQQQQVEEGGSESSNSLEQVKSRSDSLVQQSSNLDEQSSSLEQDIRDQIVADLGLSRLPDINMANISLEEYSSKLSIYRASVAQTAAIQELRQHFQAHLQHSAILIHQGPARRKRSPTHAHTAILHFQLAALPHNLLVTTATLHLTFRRRFSTENATANSKDARISLVQLIEGDMGIVLDSVALQPTGDNADETDQSVQLDVAHAIQAWLLDPEANNKGLQLQMPTDGAWELVDDDDSEEARPHIRLDALSSRVPASVYLLRSKRSLFLSSEPSHATAGRTDCRAGGSAGHACCRQHMTVRLRELEGFGFIMQPAEFDAFYCRGKCPARYLPRNDHSLLQSLLHLKSQQRKGAGDSGVPRIKRPCCNPSRFESIDILHLDEMDPTRLKVTHWKNIIVSECACA